MLSDGGAVMYVGGTPVTVKAAPEGPPISRAATGVDGRDGESVAGQELNVPVQPSIDRRSGPGVRPDHQRGAPARGGTRRRIQQHVDRRVQTGGYLDQLRL